MKVTKNIPSLQEVGTYNNITYLTPIEFMQFDTPFSNIKFKDAFGNIKELYVDNREIDFASFGITVKELYSLKTIPKYSMDIYNTTVYKSFDKKDIEQYMATNPCDDNYCYFVTSTLQVERG